MRWWKVLGLAGVAGVAATGVVIARAERRRQAYTPDEIRTRLRARLEEPPEDDLRPIGASDAVPAAAFSDMPAAAKARRSLTERLREPVARLGALLRRDAR
ncbi:hypothetical protein [Streptosporangium sp. NPDC023615]|uniref:hypothetical protein n=1 Tax=Streptosporangium sp. NPDC023615 TaxID=3154794 RepID=UPI0034336D69